MRALACVALCATLLSNQQGTPRDQSGRPQRRVGTGVIKGRVIAGDTGAPIRRARVTIYSEGEPAAGGTALTDASGRFTVERLPADTYRLTVTPNRFHSRYLSRPMAGIAAAGSVITVTLRDGEVVENVDVPLTRAATITGHVVDENGEALSGLFVTTERARGTPDTGSGRSDSSDDLGRFRIYNLAPGDYYVLVKGGEAEDLNPGAEQTAFFTTYAPGTTARTDATRVHVDAGREVGIDIRMVRGRMFRIAGMLLDSQGRPASAGHVSLSQSDRFGSRGTSGFLDRGRFTLPPQPPGDYVLSGKIVDDSEEAIEYGQLRINLADSDLTDLIITTKPSVALSGRVVYLEGPPPVLPAMQIGAVPLQRTYVVDQAPTYARLNADLTFSIKRAFGAVLLRPYGLPGDWHLRAVLRGDEDITDTPTEFSVQDAGKLQFVVSSRMSAIEGSLLDTESRQGNIVLVFPENPALRFTNCTCVRESFTDRNGRFKVTGLRAGRYFVIAMRREQAEGYREAGPEFFESLVSAATPLWLTDDEVRSVDLKLSSGG